MEDADDVWANVQNATPEKKVKPAAKERKSPKPGHSLTKAQRQRIRKQKEGAALGNGTKVKKSKTKKSRPVDPPVIGGDLVNLCGLSFERKELSREAMRRFVFTLWQREFRREKFDIQQARLFYVLFGVYLNQLREDFGEEKVKEFVVPDQRCKPHKITRLEYNFETKRVDAFFHDRRIVNSDFTAEQGNSVEFGPFVKRALQAMVTGSGKSRKTPACHQRINFDDESLNVLRAAVFDIIKRKFDPWRAPKYAGSKRSRDSHSSSTSSQSKRSKMEQAPVEQSDNSEG